MRYKLSERYITRDEKEAGKTKSRGEMNETGGRFR